MDYERSQNTTHVHEALGRKLLSVVGNQVGPRTVWDT